MQSVIVLKGFIKYIKLLMVKMELTPSECRSSRPEVFCKKDVLRNFAKYQDNICVRVTLLCSIIVKETLAQVFSCEFCEICKTTFSCRIPPATASVSGISHTVTLVNWPIQIYSEQKYCIFCKLILNLSQKKFIYDIEDMASLA